MSKKDSLYLIIHPNFRNGGAERSALNSKPNYIITYGEYLDKNFIKYFENIRVFKSRFEIFIFLIKLSIKYNLLLETNQLSACYFWILTIFPSIFIIHAQRLSLKGELLLSKTNFKRILNFLAFNVAPLLVEVRVPSNDLIKDYLFNKNSVFFKPNKIFSKDINSIDPLLNKQNDIVIVSRNSKEKKLIETLDLLNNILIKKRKLTVIGCDLGITFDNFEIKYIERIIDRDYYYQIISTHKVGILFSYAEGFGNVIPEYIFCNVWPIVNNCQWGPSETLKKYQVGTILDWQWGDSYDLIRKKSMGVDKIIDNDNLIEQHVRNSVRKNHEY